MDKTQFAGLTRLNPGESLGVDGYSFQHINPQIIDRLLQLGAVDHRHDGHARLPDPTDLPTVSEVTGGGQILADTTVWACYTLVDADGGETRPSTAQSVTTPAALDSPDDSPAVALDTTAGALLVNTYMYALTLLDGNGGETPIGPAANIQRPPGPANARVLISGLSSIATASGATGWRLWRSVGGARWGYLATGDAATDTFTDDGATSLDCTQVPPTRNTTNAVNQVRVVVPNTQPVGTVSFRVYLSEDGSFASPSLAGTYPIADAGSNKDFPGLSLADGQPPAASLSMPGAARINADTDVYGLHWLAPVANAAALPSVGNVHGDVRVTMDDFVFHVWGDDDAWHAESDGAGLRWLAPVANSAALPSTGNTHGDVRVSMDDFVIHVWGDDDAWHDVGGGGGGGGGGATWTGLVYGSPPDYVGWRGSDTESYEGLAKPPGEWYKDSDGVVHIHGLVKPVVGNSAWGPGSLGSSYAGRIALLPVGARPVGVERFPVPIYSGGIWALIIVEVRPDGIMGPIQWIASDGTSPATYGDDTVEINLAGISYPAA